MVESLKMTREEIGIKLKRDHSSVTFAKKWVEDMRSHEKHYHTVYNTIEKINQELL